MNRNEKANPLRRWRRKQLADLWECSDRKVDRMARDGRLGEPAFRLGRTPLWTDEQRLAAERAGASEAA